MQCHLLVSTQGKSINGIFVLSSFSSYLIYSLFPIHSVKEDFHYFTYFVHYKHFISELTLHLKLNSKMKPFLSCLFPFLPKMCSPLQTIDFHNFAIVIMHLLKWILTTIQQWKALVLDNNPNTLSI